MKRALSTVILACAVLYLSACAAKLMPYQAIVQPSSANEVVAARYKDEDVILLISRLGKEGNTALVVSGPFAKAEVGLVADPKGSAEDFRTLRGERAWLLFEFSCGRRICQATYHYRQKGDYTAMVKDWWIFNKYHPRLPKADVGKWVGECLAERGLATDWKY